MIYGYIRVSTDKQDLDNQRFELTNFTNKKNLTIDKWIEEKISSTESLNKRKFGTMMKKFKKGDILIVSELSRIGRNLMQIMSILNFCMENDIMVYTVKENYELGNNINSKVLAFAFGLSAEIERNLISQRTKEALARKRAEGVILGRPVGSKSAKTKLTGQEKKIQELLDKKVSYSAIGRIIGVNRLTVSSHIERYGLRVKKKCRVSSVPLADFKLTENKIVTLFEECHLSVSILAKKLNTTPATLKRYTDRMGYSQILQEMQVKERRKFPNRDGRIYGDSQYST